MTSRRRATGRATEAPSPRSPRAGRGAVTMPDAARRRAAPRNFPRSSATRAIRHPLPDGTPLGLRQRRWPRRHAVGGLIRFDALDEKTASDRLRLRPRGEPGEGGVRRSHVEASGDGCSVTRPGAGSARRSKHVGVNRVEGRRRHDRLAIERSLDARVGFGRRRLGGAARRPEKHDRAERERGRMRMRMQRERRCETGAFGRLSGRAHTYGKD